MSDPGHEGHGGWSIEDTTNGRDGLGSIGDWINRDHPTVILLMLGTNDGLVPIDQMRLRYTDLFNSIFAANANQRVVWGSIPASYEPNTGRQDWEPLVNGLVSQMSAEFAAAGKRVAYADCYDGFNWQTDLADDYHPNAAGYLKIANAFAGGMHSNAVPEPATLLTLGASILLLRRRARS